MAPSVRWKRKSQHTLFLLAFASGMLVFFAVRFVEHIRDTATLNNGSQTGMVDSYGSQQHDFRYQLDNNRPSKIFVIKSSRPRVSETSEKPREKNIAIVLAITSKRVRYDNSNYEDILKSFPFFTNLFPSFCQTAETNYSYHFYLAFDTDDPFFTEPENLLLFLAAFTHAVDVMNCNQVAAWVHYVQCRHTGSPTWAQNDAILEAYLDGMEYFYRVNDDTEMLSTGWTSIFIQALQTFSPPNLGVVGPNHREGNEKILTYEFTHKTHLDIFGFYYPRAFPGWFGDTWITGVYYPGRTLKVNDVTLRHTRAMGIRYTVHTARKRQLPVEWQRGKAILERYIKHARSPCEVQKDPSLVIAMALTNHDPDDIYGAIRNAQLAPVVFPRWTLRLYVPATSIVPPRVLRKLTSLGADVIRVTSSEFPAAFWSWRVAADRDVRFYLIRNPRFRLSAREFISVQEWVQSGKAFHCIRDLKSHIHQAIVPDLWGMDARSPSNQLIVKILDQLKHQNQDPEKSIQSVDVLQKLYPLLQDHMYCHDSVSCGKWPLSVNFTMAPGFDGRIGQAFDATMELMQPAEAPYDCHQQLRYEDFI